MEALLKKLLGLDKLEAELDEASDNIEASSGEIIEDLVDEIAGQAGGSFGRWLVK